MYEKIFSLLLCEGPHISLDKNICRSDSYLSRLFRSSWSLMQSVSCELLGTGGYHLQRVVRCCLRRILEGHLCK